MSSLHLWSTFEVLPLTSVTGFCHNLHMCRNLVSGYLYWHLRRTFEVFWLQRVAVSFWGLQFEFCHWHLLYAVLFDWRLLSSSSPKIRLFFGSRASAFFVVLFSRSFSLGFRFSLWVFYLIWRSLYELFETLVSHHSNSAVRSWIAVISDLAITICRTNTMTV